MGIKMGIGHAPFSHDFWGQPNCRIAQGAYNPSYAAACKLTN